MTATVDPAWALLLALWDGSEHSLPLSLLYTQINKQETFPQNQTGKSLSANSALPLLLLSCGAEQPLLVMVTVTHLKGLELGLSN